MKGFAPGGFTMWSNYKNTGCMLCQTREFHLIWPAYLTRLGKVNTVHIAPIQSGILNLGIKDRIIAPD